ncbi:MAG: BspA family leucine-rich repeat surface protein, partial [Lachnospiraceae bacterium]|nr:BspA family leucine-rich repeat surface protein [Lachnospiraceae bacterium]
MVKNEGKRLLAMAMACILTFSGIPAMAEETATVAEAVVTETTATDAVASETTATDAGVAETGAAEESAVQKSGMTSDEESVSTDSAADKASESLDDEEELSAQKYSPQEPYETTVTDWGLAQPVTYQNQNCVLISDYVGDETDILIPAEILGQQVIFVGIGAEDTMSGGNAGSVITSVTFEEGVIGVPYTLETPTQGFFQYCEKLETADLSNLSTSAMSDMHNMFAGCKSLSEVNLGGLFTTGTATDMSGMFCNCESLQELDLSGFDTEAVAYTSSMFEGCTNLQMITVSEYFTTDAVLEPEADKDMFKNCTSLRGDHGTAYDERYTDKTYAIIDGGEADPGYFTADNGSRISTPEDWQYELDDSIVENGTSVPTIRLKLYTPSEENNKLRIPKYMTVSGNSYRVALCGINSRDSQGAASSLHSLSFEKGVVAFDCVYEDGIGSYGLFANCINLTELDLRGLDTSRMTTMRNMFGSCRNLESLDLSMLDTSSCTCMGFLFKDCQSLSKVNLDNVDTSKVIDAGGMFRGCSALTELDLSSFDTSSVERIANMFNGCTNLETIYVSDRFVLDP